MRLSPRLAVVVILCFSSVAYADTLFYLSGTLRGLTSSYPSTSAFMGTVAIDTVNGTFTAANIQTAKGSFSSITSQFQGMGGPYGADYSGVQLLRGTPDEGSVFTLLIPQPFLVGYGGGAICSDVIVCTLHTFVGPEVLPTYVFETHSSGTVIAAIAQQGSLTPAASPVPEPSTLALLGTGAAGLLSFRRRR